MPLILLSVTVGTFRAGVQRGSCPREGGSLEVGTFEPPCRIAQICCVGNASPSKQQKSIEK